MTSGTNDFMSFHSTTFLRYMSPILTNSCSVETREAVQIIKTKLSKRLAGRLSNLFIYCATGNSADLLILELYVNRYFAGIFFSS